VYLRSAALASNVVSFPKGLPGVALSPSGLPAAIADLLEQVDQAVDALGAGRHQTQSLDQALDVRFVQGMLRTTWRCTLGRIVALSGCLRAARLRHRAMPPAQPAPERFAAWLRTLCGHNFGGLLEVTGKSLKFWRAREDSNP
jgi:hypothetical protein